MRAETAAAYVDERSVESFLHAVGIIYAEPITVPGKGKRWLIDALDESIERLSCSVKTIRDIGDAL